MEMIRNNRIDICAIIKTKEAIQHRIVDAVEVYLNQLKSLAKNQLSNRIRVKCVFFLINFMFTN
jgi:hypothetical protein